MRGGAGRGGGCRLAPPCARGVRSVGCALPFFAAFFRGGAGARFFLWKGVELRKHGVYFFRALTREG